MKRNLKKIAIVLLCIVIFLSSTVGLTMMIINTSLAPTGKIGLSVSDTMYGSKMYKAVCNSLEKKMALVAISFDDVSDILTEDVVRKAAPEVSVMLAKRILGTNTTEWRYKDEALLLRIEEKLTAYAEANGIEYEDGSANEVYEMICDTVSAELNVVPQSYVSKISPIFVKVRGLCKLWPIPIAVFVLACAGVILLGRRHPKRTIYTLMLPAYFSAFTVFCVSTILYSKDYLAKTVLGNEMLQYYIRGIYNAIISELKQISGVFVFVYLLVAALVIIAIATDRKRRRKHHHHHHSKGFEDEQTANTNMTEQYESVDISDLIANNPVSDTDTE